MSFTARVLVFDNDPSQPLLLAGRLGDLGYHNMYASSYEEAMEIAREDHPYIVIINAGVIESERAKLEESLRDMWHNQPRPDHRHR